MKGFVQMTTVFVTVFEAVGLTVSEDDASCEHGTSSLLRYRP